LDAVIAAFAMLGGSMAYSSGLAATSAQAAELPRDLVGEVINEGIAEGFIAGVPAAVLALMIVLWS